MRDTRSSEIKKILKKEYPNAKFSVRIDKYSMGESINISTDLVAREVLTLPNGEEVNGYAQKTIDTIHNIERMLKDFKHVDRDDYGEILSGGNTFLFVEGIY